MKKQIKFLIVIFILILSPQSQCKVNLNFDSLDICIENSFADFELTGLAIAIIKDSNIVFSKGYGYRDYEKQQSMTTKSLFNIASCSKAFTAACLAKLVENGKLNWKDKVVDFVPYFKLSDPYITQNLNIIDLLSHRSGLETFDGDLLWYETDYDDQEIIRRMRYIPIRKEFRSEYGYQNNMYLIAGEIIKMITGKSWSTYIYENFFKSLEMDASKTCYNDIKEDQEFAEPHLRQKVIAPSMRKPNPAGSIYSNVEDMAKWIMMLLNEGKHDDKQILSTNTIEKLFSPTTVMSISSIMEKSGIHFRTYGLGWVLYDFAGRKIVEHSGGMPGYISRIALVPEEKLGFIILTNNMNNFTNALKYKILADAFHKKGVDWISEYLKLNRNAEQSSEKERTARAAKRVTGTKPSLMLEKYCGMYEDQMYGKAKIQLDQKQLKLTLLPTKEIFASKMEHWHFDIFRIKFKDEFLPEGFIIFEFNSNQEIIGFKIDLPNPDFHFKYLDFKKVE